MCDMTVKCSECDSTQQKYKLNYIGLNIIRDNNFPLGFSLSFPSFKYGFCHATNVYKYKCSNGHIFSSTYTTK